MQHNYLETQYAARAISDSIWGCRTSLLQVEWYCISIFRKKRSCKWDCCESWWAGTLLLLGAPECFLRENPKERNLISIKRERKPRHRDLCFLILALGISQRCVDTGPWLCRMTCEALTLRNCHDPIRVRMLQKLWNHYVQKDACDAA